MGYDYNRILSLIDESPYSRKKIFSKVGISESNFTKWQTGLAIPRAETMSRLAKLLGVTVRDFREIPPLTESSQLVEFRKEHQSLVHPISNFSFLEDQFEELCTDAYEVEDLYLSSKYNPSITTLGTLLETMVNEIFDMEGYLPDDLQLYENTQYGRTRFLYDKNVIPARLRDIINEIRITRNDILHHRARISAEKAEPLIKAAHEFCLWFAHTYGDNCTNIKFISLNEIANQRGSINSIKAPAIVAQAENSDAPRTLDVSMNQESPLDTATEPSDIAVETSAKSTATYSKQVSSKLEPKLELSNYNTLKEYLEQAGMLVIDKRPSNGCLWVVGTPDSIGTVIEQACEIYGVSGSYCKGGRATDYRPGWFTRAKGVLPKLPVFIDYSEVTTAQILCNKYLGKISGLLILEDPVWTNDYCFVVDQITDDGMIVEGICYRKGRYHKCKSYDITKQFRVYNGPSVATITAIHSSYKNA